MKVTRAALVFVSCIAIVCIASTRARFSRNASEQQLRFAQLTGAHLFDESWKQPLAEAYRTVPDSWKALDRSIERINELTRGGKGIDFVVYTGDLGLRNITFSDSKACLVKDTQVSQNSPPTPEELAANELIGELDRLNVRTVFFVSGSNDPAEGDGGDGRFDCFLLALQERAQALARPLRIQNLGPDHCFALKGFHLLGLNSAAFQNVANHQRVCGPRVQTGLPQQLLDGSCPQSEVGRLREQVSSGEPTLLFTHVPDLKDPLRHEPAWDLDDRIRRQWEMEARRPNVLGLFAGHFQASTRGFYGTSDGIRALAVDPQVAAKTYLAPPLAVKNQLSKSTAPGGFLLVTVNRTRISNAEVQWIESER